MENLNSSANRARAKQKEGLYADDDGKNVNYKDRISDQEEIKLFTEKIFTEQNNVLNNRMSYEAYERINS